MMKTERNGEKNKNLCVVAMILALLFFIGCVPSWNPSDKQAAKLVRSYYLFNDSGEAVQATVAKRGEFIEECECFPIKFKITFSNRKINNKTFYFYKNTAGNVAIKEFIKINTFSAN